MSAYNSPQPSNSDHIRHLLYQRNAPAFANHAHFPSATEFPDSPSIYSHPQFTPRTFDRDDVSELHHARSTASDQEHFNLSLSSNLDHDDERRSYASNISIYDHDRTAEDYLPDEDQDPEHRMSLLGIKMRVHSKAPWEIGEDDIAEEDEPDHTSMNRPSSRSKRSHKSFGNNRRPSDESSRTGSTGKHSFETSSSQLSARGALQALAHASMSSSSLSTTPPYKESVRQKLSLPRLRSRTASNSNASYDSTRPYVRQVSPVSILKTSSPTRSEYSKVHRLDTHSPLSRSPSPPLSHPYANPEHARSFTGDTKAYNRSDSSCDDSAIVGSSDSHGTLMTGRTSSSIENYAFSTVSTPSNHSSSSNAGKDRFRIKEISAPIPISTSALQSRNTSDEGNRRETRIFTKSSGSGIAGWKEPSPSAFTLISLEEARAQRARTLASQSEKSEPDPLAFPQVETPASSGSNVFVKARARSSSLGGKSKESIRFISKSDTLDDSAPPYGKSLKHKKSGFMRIFSGKEKDRALIPPFPPVPSFSEVIPPVPRTPKLPPHRVPVPSLPLKDDAEHDSSADSSSSHEDGTVGEGSSLDAISTKRVPMLSINTSTSVKRLFGNSSLSSISNDRLQSSNSFTGSAAVKDLPQSAPPSTTDFVGLRLRPVSTMFSSHFSDHLLDPKGAQSERGSPPSLDLDTGTSITTPMSPRSVDFSLHSSQTSDIDKSTVSQDDGRSYVVDSLHNQISVAKLAWQRHIWELEGQIRDLKAELEELRDAEGSGEYCDACGRGHRKPVKEGANVSVVNRSRGLNPKI